MQPVVLLMVAPIVLGPAPGPRTAWAEPPPLALVLQGRVEDRATRKPIAGATVRVGRIVSGTKDLADPEYPAETSLKTDAVGRIKVVFPSGQVGDPRLFVSFAVSHPGYVAQSAAPIPLAQLDFERRQGGRPSLGVILLERGLEYEGRVLTPDGKPAADVPFEFGAGNEAPFAEAISFQPSNVRGHTDPDGRIRLRAAPTDVIHLRFAPTNWAPRHMSWGSDPRDPGYKTWNRQELGEHRLERGFVIAGRLLDLKGRPLPRQKLVAVGGEAAYRRSAETGSDGRFAFEPLPPGKYLIGAADQLVVDWNPKAPTPSPSGPVIKPVAVEDREGRPPGPVELREVETAEVVIRHVDARGQPFRGCPIQLGGGFLEAPDLREAGGEPATPEPDLVWAVQGMAGADGTLALRVPRGLQASFAVTPPPDRMAVMMRLSRDGPLEWTTHGDLGVVDGDRRDITLVWYRAPAILARIETSEGGPPGDARLVVSQRPNSKVSEVNFVRLPDGRFRVGPLRPGVAYWARAEAEGYEGSEVRISLPEAAVEEVTLELKRARELKKAEEP